MKVGIVGGNGVGMAHAIACVKLGYKIEWILDIDYYSTSKNYTTNKLVNRWESIEEEINIDYAPLILTNLNYIKDIVDLIIIAVPNYFHSHYINRLYKYTDKILCEKPLSCFIDNKIYPFYTNLKLNYMDNIYVGYEWLYSDNLINYINDNEINFIAQCINYKNRVSWRDEDSALTDIGFHILSIINKKYKNVKLKLNYFSNDIFQFDVKHNNGIIKCFGGFNLSSYNINTIKGVSTNSNIKDFDLMINDKIFGWEENLFEKQLYEIENGNGVTCEFGKEVDCMMSNLLDSYTGNIDFEKLEEFI